MYTTLPARKNESTRATTPRFAARTVSPTWPWKSTPRWRLVTFPLNTRPEPKRLVISDYFLNEDAAGKVHAEGDHKIHVAKVRRDRLELDPRFQLDFNTAFASGPARPHGLVMK